MHRVVVPPEALRAGTVTITDPKELHHLLRVVRLKRDDQVECLDGAGRRARGTVTKREPGALVLHLDPPVRDPEASCRLTLALALIRPERFEWAIQKATELGVHRIVPLVTARVVARIASEAAERKRLRWERITREAAAQCNRANVPELAVPQTLAVFAATLRTTRPAVIATLAVPSVPLPEALAQVGEGLTILIGPEGDFTKDEVLQCQRAGATPVSLGAHTLRAETAALAALAMVQYRLMST